MRRLAAVMVGLVVLVAAGPAEGHVSRTGQALTASGLTVRLAHPGERRVWLWRDYWACRVVAAGTPTPTPTPYVSVIALGDASLVCRWVKSRWAWVPAGERCVGVPLDGDANYRVTVCR